MANEQPLAEGRERRRGQHLTLFDRGVIQAGLRAGRSLRAIAREVGCSPSTVANEIKRGTPERKSPVGRPPVYEGRRGQKIYEEHRLRCHRPAKVRADSAFVRWLVPQVRGLRWSLDFCVGHARCMTLFPAQDIPCTKSLYNALHAGRLPLKVFEFAEVPRRSSRGRLRVRQSRGKRRSFCRPIDTRSCRVWAGIDFGHWELDTVMGRKTGDKQVVLTLLEKSTHMYMALLIPGRTSAAVMSGFAQLRELYGEEFGSVFKSITADNGSEFAELSQLEKWGTQAYSAHAYSSWERGQNERHNGLLRRYIPKGVSLDTYSQDEIDQFIDEINTKPRRSLGYRTADELFEEQLDKIYELPRKLVRLGKEK